MRMNLPPVQSEGVSLTGATSNESKTRGEQGVCPNNPLVAMIIAAVVPKRFIYFGKAQVKFAASSALPVPL
jgi:hypothetical protein